MLLRRSIGLRGLADLRYRCQWTVAFKHRRSTEGAADSVPQREELSVVEVVV